MRRRLDHTARRSLTLPWWVILLMAPVVYAVLAHGLALIRRGPLGKAFIGAAWILGAFTATGIVVIAAIVALHQRRARELLDRQTHLESIRRLPWREFECLVAHEDLAAVRADPAKTARRRRSRLPWRDWTGCWCSITPRSIRTLSA